MANTISNMDDVIDSRDVIERIEYLTEEQENWAEEHPEADFMATEEGEELRVLLALQEEAEGYCSDWTYAAHLLAFSGASCCMPRIYWLAAMHPAVCRASIGLQRML